MQYTYSLQDIHEGIIGSDNMSHSGHPNNNNRFYNSLFYTMP